MPEYLLLTGIEVASLIVIDLVALDRTKAGLKLIEQVSDISR